METIPYIERTTGKREQENIYGGWALRFLYSANPLVRLIAAPFLLGAAKTSLASRFYGWLQTRPASRGKIAPFINTYGVDATEFEHSPETYESFNAFFTRTLKKSARPIQGGADTAVIPADARYRFFPELDKVDGFVVKGERFSLETLLQDKDLASHYQKGAMVIARLCPVDYHRFHFPCDSVPGRPRLINGWLYSVNPIALKRTIHIFTQNKRVLTELKTEAFGHVQFIEVGATNVGTICQTFTPETPCKKGEEKGYFSFGGSALILLFEEGAIRFSDDLLKLSAQGLEIRCQLGQEMGKSQG